MTTYEIVGWVIQHFEGFKYTDDPVDLGGATKFGITRKTLEYARRKWTGNPTLIVTKEDVRNLTLDEAIRVGIKVFAVEPRIDEIFDWRTRLIVYDYGFHSGQKRAIKALQVALGFTLDQQDGIIGNVTLDAVNLKPQLEVAVKVLTAREEFMQDIMESRHSQRRYVLGWWKRTTSLQKMLA